MALLSNRLHSFEDNSPAAKPVIDKIIELRNQWKETRIRIEHYEKFGSFPTEAEEKKNTAGEAELRLSITQAQSKIRKNRLKLRNTPEHSNAPAWEAEINMLMAHIEESKSALIRLTYAKQ